MVELEVTVKTHTVTRKTVRSTHGIIDLGMEWRQACGQLGFGTVFSLTCGTGLVGRMRLYDAVKHSGLPSHPPALCCVDQAEETVEGRKEKETLMEELCF